LPSFGASEVCLCFKKRKTNVFWTQGRSDVCEDEETKEEKIFGV
jgi:hypothetical protein